MRMIPNEMALHAIRNREIKAGIKSDCISFQNLINLKWNYDVGGDSA